MKELTLIYTKPSVKSIFEILEDSTVISENENGFTKDPSISGSYSILRLKDNGLKIRSITGTYSYTDRTNGLSFNFFSPSPTLDPDYSKNLGILDEWSDPTRGFHVLSNSGDLIYKNTVNEITITKTYSTPTDQKDFYLYIGRFTTYAYNPVYCKNLIIEYS